MSRRFITLSDDEFQMGVDMENTSHYSAREIQRTATPERMFSMIMLDKPEVNRRMLLHFYLDQRWEVKS
jgi:hypothetical protein